MSTKKPTGKVSGEKPVAKRDAIPAASPAASPAAAPDDDPPPIPPERPAPEECCNSGCIPCVYDLYDEAMDRYREELKAWRARHEPPTA